MEQMHRSTDITSQPAFESCELTLSGLCLLGGDHMFRFVQRLVIRVGEQEKAAWDLIASTDRDGTETCLWKLKWTWMVAAGHRDSGALIVRISLPALFLGRSCSSAGLHSDAPHPGPTPAERSCPAERSGYIRAVSEGYYLNLFFYY